MNQRGVAESTQWAILLPLLLTLVLGLIQLGVWLYSRTAAAQAAATVADLRASGSEESARQAGLRIAQAGGLQQVEITIAQRGNRLQVTVSGAAPLPVLLGDPMISEVAVLPLEQVSAP